MFWLPHRTGLIATSVVLSLACCDALAQAAVVEFKFPRDRGSLRLRDAPCRNADILRLYEGDIPEPFLAGTLDLTGRVLSGCWYEADGHVFFTDSEGDLLVPMPPVGVFSPLANGLRTTDAVNPAVPPAAGLPRISRGVRRAGLARARP